MPSTPIFPPPLSVGPPAPEPKKPSKASEWAKAAPLLAMLPMVLKKGGPQGMTAFLMSMQAAQQQRQQQQEQRAVQQQQQQRQVMLDERLFANDAAAEQDRQQQQQRLFLSDFSSKLQNVSTPEDAQKLVDAYAQFGAGVGVQPAQLQAVAEAIANEETLTKRRVESLLKSTDKDLVQQWVQGQGNLLVDGKPMPFERWSKYLPMATDAQGKPITGQKPTGPIAPDIPLDRQHAAALVAGNTALAKQIEEAMSRQDATRRDPQRQPIQITVGGSGLTKPQIDTAASLRDDYRTESKDFFAARDGYERALAAATDPSPAGDLALIYGYMKLLDPNSVVRETEFATAARSGSLPQQIQAAALKIVNGERLTREQRADFITRAKTLFGRAQNRQNSRRTRYEGMATQFGLPASLVVADDDAEVDEDTGTPPPPAAVPATGRGHVPNPFRR